MSQYVALFRGINVGGHHSLPMQDLRDILSALGCDNVRTYIQSGNAVFESGLGTDKLAQEIGAAVNAKFGFEPRVLLINAAKFRQIATENPFREMVDDPKTLHVTFLAEPAREPDLDGINDVKIESERYDLSKHAFYLYAPEGIGRSKLAQKVDRLLGVETTGRNLNTISKLLAMIDAD